MSNTLLVKQQSSESKSDNDNDAVKITVLKNVDKDNSNVPPIWVDGKKFKGDGLKQNVSDFPTVLKGVSKWFEKSVVNLGTYGGYGPGDLSCFFYSVMSGISPDLQNVSNPWKGVRHHVDSCGRINHGFKSGIAVQIMSDLDTPTPDDLKESGLSRRGWTVMMETKIKKKYLYSQKKVLSDYYRKIMEIYGLKLDNFGEPIRGKKFDNFIKQMKDAIDEKDEVLEDIKYFKKKGMKSELEENIEYFASNKMKYNNILETFEAEYPDPRLHKPFNEDSGIEIGKPIPYIFPKNVRNLPLTTSIFNTPVMFDTEIDFRGDEFDTDDEPGRAPPLSPLNGNPKLETVIDQMLTRKMHGISSFDLVAQTMGINILLMDPSGEPRNNSHIRHSTDVDVDIVKLIYERAANKVFPEDLDDSDALCVCVVFQPGHFEAVAVLHDIPSKLNKRKTIAQSQTIFSYYDPFVQKFLGRYKENKDEMIAAGKRSRVKPSSSKPKPRSPKPKPSSSRPKPRSSKPKVKPRSASPKPKVKPRSASPKPKPKPKVKPRSASPKPKPKPKPASPKPKVKPRSASPKPKPLSPKPKPLSPKPKPLSPKPKVKPRSASPKPKPLSPKPKPLSPKPKPRSIPRHAPTPKPKPQRKPIPRRKIVPKPRTAVPRRQAARNNKPTHHENMKKIQDTADSLKLELVDHYDVQDL
jgi:hypothetical protein